MPAICYSSPIGPLLVAAENGYITEISFMDADTRAKFRDSSPDIGKDPSPITDLCIKELDDYFAGKLQHFTTPIKLSSTPFRMQVWEALMTIPYGKTVSYKELAVMIGNPKAIRAVGGANHNNPISIIVPCHRVIGADGTLTGYGGGLNNKAFLLDLEVNG